MLSTVQETEESRTVSTPEGITGDLGMKDSIWQSDLFLLVQAAYRRGVCQIIPAPIIPTVLEGYQEMGQRSDLRNYLHTVRFNDD